MRDGPLYMYISFDEILKQISILIVETYTDGCAKLKSLEDQLYAFTDSGADPEKVAANIEESLKTQTLKQQVQNLKATMSVVTPIPEKSKRDTSRLTGKKRRKFSFI